MPDLLLELNLSLFINHRVE